MLGAGDAGIRCTTVNALLTRWRTSMRKAVCRHCGEAIGEWTDPWGGHAEWMHQPDDGPDAHVRCRCKCSGCSGDTYEPIGGWQGAADPCIDGEEAEPR